MADYAFRIRVHRGLANFLLHTRTDDGQRRRELLREQFPHLRVVGDVGLNYCCVTANITSGDALQVVLDVFAMTPEAQAAMREYEDHTRALCNAAWQDQLWTPQQEAH